MKQVRKLKLKTRNKNSSSAKKAYSIHFEVDKDTISIYKSYTNNTIPYWELPSDTPSYIDKIDISNLIDINILVDDISSDLKELINSASNTKHLTCNTIIDNVLKCNNIVVIPPEELYMKLLVSGNTIEVFRMSKETLKEYEQPISVFIPLTVRPFLPLFMLINLNSSSNQILESHQNHAIKMKNVPNNITWDKLFSTLKEQGAIVNYVMLRVYPEYSLFVNTEKKVVSLIPYNPDLASSTFEISDFLKGNIIFNEKDIINLGLVQKSEYRGFGRLSSAHELVYDMLRKLNLHKIYEEESPLTELHVSKTRSTTYAPNIKYKLHEVLKPLHTCILAYKYVNGSINIYSVETAANLVDRFIEIGDESRSSLFTKVAKTVSSNAKTITLLTSITSKTTTSEVADTLFSKEIEFYNMEHNLQSIQGYVSTLMALHKINSGIDYFITSKSLNKDSLTVLEECIPHFNKTLNAVLIT